MRGEDITTLLVEWSNGSESALERLLPFVYEELRTVAKAYLRRERPGQTVQTGTLVRQAFIRLIEGKQIQWEGRTHFFGVAARLMRQILVDHARARDAVKRGAGQSTDALAGALTVAVQALDVDVIALDRALEELSVVDPQQARIVELRFSAVSPWRRPPRPCVFQPAPSNAIGAWRARGCGARWVSPDHEGRGCAEVGRGEGPLPAGHRPAAGRASRVPGAGVR